MAPSLTLTIPSATISTAPGKPYTIYKLALRQPLRSYTLEKRYSDFVALHAALQEQTGADPPASLPQKTWFKSTLNNPVLTESRRRGLEEYVTAINENVNSVWRNTAAWRAFLKLPSTGSGTTSLAGSGDAVTKGRVGNAQGTAQATTSDPSVWLDAHRSLKGQLRDVRVALTKRDQAGTAQAQHAASAEAKGVLARAAAGVRALDEGLKAPEMTAALGPGELRRRRDEVVKARKEMASLENMLSTFTARSDEGGQAQASGAEREELFKSAGGATTAGGGRRVLGGPLKETERTRELDNEGVLQLQKQIMQEQDLDVGDLTKVVQRMKEMGIQINNELELQNEMLGLLDQDVNRVEGKIGVAKKRLGKIK